MMYSVNIMNIHVLQAESTKNKIDNMCEIYYIITCDRYRTSKMTTAKSDLLLLHDGCVIAICHQGVGRFSWRTLGIQCVANAW